MASSPSFVSLAGGLDNAQPGRAGKTQSEPRGRTAPVAVAHADEAGSGERLRAASRIGDQSPGGALGAGVPTAIEATCRARSSSAASTMSGHQP